MVAVGSSNTEMTIISRRLPSQGETVAVGGFFQAGGRKGANQAVAAGANRG